MADKNEESTSSFEEQLLDDPKANKSYAPIRTKVHARALVDGRDTFALMTKKIEHAKVRIFMSFWIFVPTLAVRREDDKRSIDDRLDTILKKKADEGVKIYILLWDETNFAVSNYSKFNKHYMESLSPNIVVVRHPQMRPLNWSHHQKFLVVDDKHAFVGGVDFATGRYDWHEHRVVDEDGRYWWGIDLYVPQVKKATSDNFETPNDDILSNRKHFRMPWHDIQMYVTGEAALDTAFNFIQRWNHHISNTKKYSGKAKYPTLTLLNEKEYQQREADSTAVDAVQAAIASTLRPRRNSKGKQDTAQIQSAASDKGDQDDDEEEEEDDDEEPATNAAKSSPSDAPKGKHKLKERLAKMPGFQRRRVRNHTVNCQLIRSMSTWSGSPRTENSIYWAYLKAIESAQHLIYIENQFFVSGTATGPVNGLTQAIVDRISDAIAHDRPFKCIVMCAQPEDLGPKMVPVVQLQYATIGRGTSSMIQQLREKHPGVDVSQYIGFFQLRSYGLLNGLPVTDQVFVHSKLLIVDDRITIIASANFNDRSFVGTRDSELGIVVWGGADNRCYSKMGGKEFEVNKFSWTLRKQLFIEHLGLDFDSEADDTLVNDPVESTFFNNVWLATARKNTDVYESVFPSVPRDSVLTYEDYVARQPLPADATKANKLKLIKGHLTFFPLHFLAAEKTKLWESFIDDTLFQ